LIPVFTFYCSFAGAKLKNFILGAVGAVVAVSSASAADLAARPYTKAPVAVMAAAYDWSGFYLGGNAGYGWGQVSHADTTPGGLFWTFGPAGIFGGVQKINPQGAVYGGQAGYNWQRSNWVFGVEAQFNGADMKRSDISIFVPATDRLSAKIDSYGTFTGRVGYAFNNWLPYVKGGYAAAELNTRNFDIFGNFLDNTSWRSGYVVGAGLEYAFAGNWIIGVEYNYMDFGSKGFTKLNVGVNPVTPESFSDKLTVSTVTGRLSYKFGGPVVAKY
jgi:outer membrane immunogenic protein